MDCRAAIIIGCANFSSRSFRWAKPGNLRPDAAARASEPCPRHCAAVRRGSSAVRGRSEEHTSELQSLMRISYAVFCLKKKKNTKRKYTYTTQNQKYQIQHNKT